MQYYCKCSTCLAGLTVPVSYLPTNTGAIKHPVQFEQIIYSEEAV